MCFIAGYLGSSTRASIKTESGGVEYLGKVIVGHDEPSPASGGMPQTLVRASTIKLLDTYHRCGGQKVSEILIIIIFWKYCLTVV